MRNHAPGLRRPQSQRIRAVEALLDRGFPYSRKLNAHISCVNALAFSSLDGRFLASGGDDLSIHLWDLHEEQRNIFVLSFSANNRFLFSGGADQIVLKFDASQLERPLTSQPPRSPRNIFREHEGSIRGIAPHPVQDDIFITGSEDGRLILRDGRTVPGVRVRAQDTIQLTSEVTGVQFHPRMEHVFATSDGHGRVCLRDMRMGFGPLTHRTQNGVYNTKISRRSAPHLSNPETSSISFNQEGTQLGVTMLHYFPTIYALMDPDPVAVCSAANLPNGTPVPPEQRTYANACTMKHGSFGGPGLDTDTFYMAGSDDFRAYVWALPPPAALEAQRTILSHAEWEAGAHAGIVAFAESSTAPRCVPVQLNTPRARLGGHSSIVNTVLVHPRMLLAATAGVEAGIVLHGAVDSLLGGMAATSSQTRELGEEWVPDPAEEGAERWVEEQTETIELFDHLLQREGQADVFMLRRWRGDGDAADSSDSDSDSEGADQEEESDSDAVEQDVEMEETDEQDAG
ncbi:WD40 repeat-like protein [Mycena metata]|uniref:WD40 repeat-like protein n=1 Tax=Mycena metata TaxID=1033252 RepID=A0AAD7IEK8_9AGAR|nr:WD40 repeat-like protein [Mycena metata]